MSIRFFQWLQVGFLGAGNVIAWSTVVKSYQAFFAAGGEVFQFSGCSVANPLATPCFYGAIAFLVAIIWTGKQILNPTTSIQSFKYLFYLLIASTIFGWGNVLYEYYKLQTGPITACGAKTVTSVFQSSCLYGTLAFTLSLITSFVIYSSKSKVDISSK